VVRFWWRQSSSPRAAAVADPVPEAIKSAVAERTLDLLLDFGAFMALCSAADNPGSEIGRAGHRLATEFDRLAAWLEDEHAPEDEEREQLIVGLRYHRAMVHNALRFVFPRAHNRRSAELRRSLGVIGAPTLRLHDLCAELGADRRS
jgi:hypothetical protein